MLSYNEALAKIESSPRPRVSCERVPLLEARGRVLAEDLLAAEDLPATDNSAMDGFAIQARATVLASPETPLSFEVLGEWVAGAKSHAGSSRPDAVYAIMTGALVPEPAFDSVVKIEDVEVYLEGGKKFIKIFKPVTLRNNVRPRGSDYHRGQRLLPAGHRLRSQDVMALAGLGVSEVLTYEKLKVAVLSTGREIVPFAQPVLSPEQVRNSSAAFLQAYFSGLSCVVHQYQQAEDTAESFYNLFQRIIDKNYHLILTTGGVSMGSRDFVTATLADLGVRIEFHKVAIRPGKPILFGIHERTGIAVFGLPGNPVSTAVGARFFVTPYLKRLRNEKNEKSFFISTTGDFQKPQGLSCFYKARLANRGERTEVEILKDQGSYMLHSFVEADCWVYLPEELGAVVGGQIVEVFSIHGEQK